MRILGIILSIILVCIIYIYLLLSPKTFVISPLTNNLDFIEQSIPVLYFSKGNLHIINSNGKDDLLIAKNVFKYEFNNDSTKIVFDSYIDECNSKLIVYDLLKSKIIYEEIFEGSINTPRFSIDSTKILFTICKEDKEYIYFADLKLNKSKLVATYPKYNLYKVEWLKDSMSIFIKLFNINSHDNDYYKITNINLIPQITYIGKDIYNIKDLVTIPNEQISSNDYKTYEATLVPFKSIDNKFVLSDIIFTKQYPKISANNIDKFTGEKVLVKYLPIISNSPYAEKSISMYDFTPDLKYLVFSLDEKIYIVNINKNKIGILVKEGLKPVFVGKFHSKM